MEFLSFHFIYEHNPPPFGFEVFFSGVVGKTQRKRGKGFEQCVVVKEEVVYSAYLSL